MKKYIIAAALAAITSAAQADDDIICGYVAKAAPTVAESSKYLPYEDVVPGFAKDVKSYHKQAVQSVLTQAYYAWADMPKQDIVKIAFLRCQMKMLELKS